MRTPEGEDPVTRVPVISQDEHALAGLAHQAWVDRMLAAGWRLGPTYDPKAKTHDALVPFNRLDPTDRWTALVAVHCSGVAERLRETIEYPRGRERIFRPGDLREGLAVRMAEDPGAHAGGPPEVGQVCAWTVDPTTGCVSTIMVRWPDGQTTRHFAAERDLQAAE